MKIVSVAEEVGVSNSFATTAVTLLQLKDILDSNVFSTEELKEVHMLIWKCDLVHITIETIRQDFTSVHGQWYTAVALARLLANTCSLLRPNNGTTSNKALQPTSEEVEEYYDILLPTATDSLLILANNIHDFEQSTSSSVYIDQLQIIMDSILWLCSNHKLCTVRAIQSPYLLHLLVSENYTYSMCVLKILQKLIEQHKEAIKQSDTDAMLSLLDEIIFKIGGSDREQARISLKLLVDFASAQQSYFEIICSRYKGLSFLIQRWADLSLDSSTHQFISTLMQKVAISDKNYEMNKAACIIQANWRGYYTRSKLKKMERGIKKFQQLYRQRKADRKNQATATSLQKAFILSQETARKASLRKHHEKQVAVIEQLPASSISNYLAKEKKEAAVKIQSWWRGNRSREKSKREKDALKREKSAIVIQRAYRNHLLAAGKMNFYTDRLQMKNTHSVEHTTMAQDTEDVNSLLRWFNESRDKQQELDRERAALMSQVLPCFT